MTQRKRISAVLPCTAAGLAATAATAFAGDPLGMMPESAWAEGDRIDDLTYLITWVVGVTFVGVQALLVWFLWKYRSREGVRAKHTHGNHTVEMVWTVVPAAILVFLAIYQMGLWGEIKASEAPDNAGAVKVQIFAKRFEWNFRYPGADGAFGTPDDPVTSGVLFVPVNRPVNAEMRSMDVIHSFLGMVSRRFYQSGFRSETEVPELNDRLDAGPTALTASAKPSTLSRC